MNQVDMDNLARHLIREWGVKPESLTDELVPVVAQDTLQQAARELAALRERVAALEHVKEALRDMRAGKLSRDTCIMIIGNIVDPSRVTDEDLKWGRAALAAQEPQHPGAERRT